MTIAVIGAGVLGLTTALRLARAGAAVRVLDLAADAPRNASAVAAGMLAPVSETLAEGGDAEHLRRLLTARDLWPGFAASVEGLSLDRTGTDLLVEGAGAESIIARLRGWGMDFQPLAPPRHGVRLPQDWRLDPTEAIAALRAALLGLGVTIEAGRVAPAWQARGGAPALLLDGAPLAAEAVVVAAGYGARALSAAAPELAGLSPIKGQIAVFAPGGPPGRTLRAEGVYLAPQPSGARAGATMQAGEDDVAVDPGVAAGLRGAALAVQPALAGLAWRGEAGVRAATPDGWPLAGPSATPGVFLATGARRNGWLLAPLVAEIVCVALAGGAPHPLGQAFHPGRFTR